MAELVRKLKTILRPVSILSRQTDCNPAARYGFKIGLRMIGSVIHIDTRELSSWPISAKFSRRRLQHDCDVGGARYSKASGLHPDINRPEFGSLALVCCMHHADQG